MFKADSSRKNCYGSAIEYTTGTPVPEQRRLPLGQRYRFIDVSTPEMSSWVVSVTSQYQGGDGTVHPTVKVFCTWGSGGITHEAEFSAHPGCIIPLAADSLIVEATVELTVPAGGGAPPLIAKLQASTHRSFADSDPQVFFNILSAPLIGTARAVPVPPFAKSFYVTSTVFATPVITNTYDPTAWYGLTSNNGTLFQQVITGTAMRAIRDTGGAIRIPPDVDKILCQNGATAFQQGDRLVFILDL